VMQTRTVMFASSLSIPPPIWDWTGTNDLYCGFASQDLPSLWPKKGFEFANNRWILHYQGWCDKFKSQDFRAKCDERPTPIMLIEVAKWSVFGRFPGLGLNSSASWKCDDNSTRHLFSWIHRRSY
jgi:hypothetical protein